MQVRSPWSISLPSQSGIPTVSCLDTSRTKVVMSDWRCKLRDPGGSSLLRQRIATRARQQETMEANHQFVESQAWSIKCPLNCAEACRVLMPLRHVAWAANTNNSSVCAYGYGTAFTAPAMMHARIIWKRTFNILYARQPGHAVP